MPKCGPGHYFSRVPSDYGSEGIGELSVTYSCFGNVGLNIVVDYTIAIKVVSV